MFISETEREHEWGRGRERGRHRIRSRLQAQSCQHRAQCGLKLKNCEIVTELKLDVYATEPPRHPIIYLSGYVYQKSFSEIFSPLTIYFPLNVNKQCCRCKVTVWNVKCSITLNLLNSYNTKYNVQIIMTIKNVSSYYQTSPGEQNCCWWRATADRNLEVGSQAPPDMRRTIMLHSLLRGLCPSVGL